MPPELWLEIRKPVLIFLAATVLVVATIMGGLYTLEEGIPLLEGERNVRSGSAYGLEIGMTRNECLLAIRGRYGKPEHYLTVLWAKDSDLDETLQPFENPDSPRYPHHEHREYRGLITQIESINPPLELIDHWEIRIPAQWVHSIYLTFANGTLVKIQKSRWLFER